MTCLTLKLTCCLISAWPGPWWGGRLGTGTGKACRYVLPDFAR